MDARRPRAPAGLPLTAGRRFALAAGVPVCLALVLFIAFGLVADFGRGSFPVRYAVPASAASVSVSTAGGNLSLRRAVPGAATFTGTAYYSLVRPHVTERLTAGQAAFGYRCHLQFGDCGLNATLGVPAGTSVSADTGGGNVSATGISGQVTISTDGGDITATAVQVSQVIANTGGGDVEIVFTKAPRDVQVSTDGGNVTIIVPPGPTRYRVLPTSDGGTLTNDLPTAPTSPNVITATTSGGNITLQQSP